ncbi:hypothetical protein GCM10027052_02710 [Parafrigoribacterium mesophilum]
MVLVARTGAEFLPRTLAALAAQTHRPDTIIAVDAGSTDDTSALLAESGPTQLVEVPGKVGFSASVSRALRVASPATADVNDDWLWLLAHDNAPEPTALAQLLAAVEIAPSVAVAGPKLVRWDQPDVLADFGQTLSKLGATVHLVEGELDQAQHDARADVLGVAAGGMLVRRSVWNALGGFDPGLGVVDAGLDFSVRVRLAGHRVILVPGARVASAHGPELFGSAASGAFARRRAASDARRRRLVRTAQLHRRLVYAPLWALGIHWLSLVPLAVLRSLGHLLTKRPGAIPGEFRAAFVAAFAGHVTGGRRNFRRTKRLSWAAIDALRMPGAELRERRAQEREAQRQLLGQRTRDDDRAEFLGDGGFWVAVAGLVLGVVAFGPLLSGSAVVGGGLAPLSHSVADLWANAAYGWRDIGGGFVGAADPFAVIVALLGSLAFWAPSFGIALFYVAALPLAAIGAWFCARRFSSRTWLPLIAAVLWMLGPPLLASLTTGHLGAAIVQVLLPWLVLTVVDAAHSWGSAAAAALLFAAVAASAPSLVPALLVLWLLWLIAQPKSVHRLIGIPIPALALFAPLILAQLQRGNPLGLLADPGVPSVVTAPPGWRLALADAGTGLHGWIHLLDGLSLPGETAPVLVAVLLLPVGVLALLALFVPGSRRAIPAMSIALLGFVTAVIATRISVSFAAGNAITLWPGAALSLFWLGLIGGSLVALDALGRAALASGVVAAAATLALAMPLLGATLAGTAAIHPGSGRILPAIVTAQAQVRPTVGTLLISTHDGGIASELARNVGATLDEQSTLAATDARLEATEKRVANLSGNLVSRSGFNAQPDLAALDIGFVVVADTTRGDTNDKNDELRRRALDALNNNALLSPVGHTADGMLWRVTDVPKQAPELRPEDTGARLGTGILLAQGAIFALTLLLGIPTAPRRKRQATVSGARPAGAAEATSGEVN